jgi:hypothetical protein
MCLQWNSEAVRCTDVFCTMHNPVYAWFVVACRSRMREFCDACLQRWKVSAIRANVCALYKIPSTPILQAKRRVRRIMSLLLLRIREAGCDGHGSSVTWIRFPWPDRGHGRLSWQKEPPAGPRNASHSNESAIPA